MSLLDQLNLNYLRIFMSVYRTGSMTKAAKQLHLTQSGISQQIKALEEALGITLFDRINRRIVPTADAETLYIHCSERLGDLEAALESMSRHKRTLKGKVNIGFPPVFGNHVLLPHLARFSAQHPEVTFDLRLGLVAELTQALLDGKLDFAFVDAITRSPQLNMETVHEDHLAMCCPKSFVPEGLKEPFAESFFRQLPYVAYLRGEPLLRSWYQNNFNVMPHDLNIVATVIDSTSMATLIQNGMVAGILPRVLAQGFLKTAPDVMVLQQTNNFPIKICLAYLGERTMGEAASKCLTFLKNSLLAESNQ